MIAARQAISAIAPRLPPAFARPNGAVPSRADNEAFRAMALDRIVDLAFELGDGTPPVLSKAAFERKVSAGAPRVAAAFRMAVDAIVPAAAELDRTLAALRHAAKHPSGRAAIVEMYAQLEHLFPFDLMATIPLARLAQYPRYLKAIQARLQRAVSDPRKDADKLAPFAPLWSTFLVKRATARDPAYAESLRWAFEELRVAIFAPELKTPVPVSTAKLAVALGDLR
jgi:ATP-dependent helicase HrpA